MPLVPTLPLRTVVPPASVATLAAFTAVKLVWPLLLTDSAPSAPLVALPPAAPPKLTSPEPALMVRARAVALALSTVLAKLTALLVVASVASAPRVTALW